MAGREKKPSAELENPNAHVHQVVGSGAAGVSGRPNQEYQEYLGPPSPRGPIPDLEKVIDGVGRPPKNPKKSGTRIGRLFRLGKR